jgi:glutaryl-CoA dehydrogenase
MSWKPVHAVDFYDADRLLTDEEKEARESVRRFVSAEIVPIIAEHYEAGTFPKDIVPGLAKLGIFGATFPVEEGYPGRSQVAYGLMMQELERGDSAIRSFASVQSALVMFPIWKYGSAEQKEKWLPGLKSGEKIGCYGLTEPGYGSDPGSMETTAVRDGDGWILDGRKMWITNGSIADVAVVWAKKDDGEIGGFVVERGTEGFSAPLIKDKLSLRASVTSALVFKNCRVPESNRLSGTKGLGSALSCLNEARYGIAWGTVGAAMACYTAALNYAAERVQFDKPIASYQLVQRKLVKMVTEITKAQLLCLQLGRLKEAGEAKYPRVSMAKMNNAAMALDIARDARDILGALGIGVRYRVMRHMCNLESVKTYEGTDDMHRLIVGREITGLDAIR